MVRIPVSPVGLEDAVEGSWVCITGESFPPRGAWVMGCHGAVALSSEGRSWEEGERGRTRVRSPESGSVLGGGPGAPARAPTGLFEKHTATNGERNHKNWLNRSHLSLPPSCQHTGKTGP